EERGKGGGWGGGGEESGVGKRGAGEGGRAADGRAGEGGPAGGVDPPPGGPPAEIHVALDLRALAGQRGLLRLQQLPAPAVEIAADARPVEAAGARRAKTPAQMNAAAALELVAVDAPDRAAVELDLAQLAAPEVAEAHD